MKREVCACVLLLGRAVMCFSPEVTANSDIFLKLDLILLNLKGAVLSASPSKAHLAAIYAL